MQTYDKYVRVLVFPIVEAKGGVSQFSLNWFQHIDKTKFCIEFLTFSLRISYEEEIIKRGGKVIYLKNNPQTDRELFIQEFGKVLQRGYDVFYINTCNRTNTISNF